jgi:penicillin-binding protein 2
MRRKAKPLITESSQAYSFTRRAIVLGAGQGGIAALLAGRMAWISVAENEHYQMLSESNRVQMKLLPPRRGWIVDRYGQPIAINRSDFRVDLIPDQLKDPEREVALLAELLQLTSDEVQRIKDNLAEAAGYQPVPVAENLPFDKFAAVTVRLPELPGISPLRAYSRYYPDGAAVGHLVGYVGAPNKEEYQAEGKNPLLITPGFKVGKQGLERTMEQVLRGKPGAQRIEVTAHGKLVKELTTLPDVGGKPLPLTIDAGLQAYAARRLGPGSGSVVALDCNTGEILALVSMPCFDPNTFSDGISRNEWRMLSEDDHLPLLNKTVQGLYPSGSTIKPMMSLAFLEKGIDPKATVTCTGAYRVGNAIFHCDTRHGTLAMHEAIEKSCDIYFYVTSLKAGPEVIASMAHRMGLGEKFELPLVTQRFGTIPDPDWMLRKYHRKWEMYDTINMSIGQGNVLVNPLQLAVMAGRIASGRVITPRLVRTKTIPEPAPLPVTPEHLTFVREAMRDVVNRNGTARGAKLQVEGVLLAGKTGTAQVRRISMAERSSGGVRSNASLAWKMRDHSLFIGFAPADNPRYACAVVVEHGGFGAQFAAPACRDILTFLYDKPKALEALAAMEQQWGGGIPERMAAKAKRWAQANHVPTPGERAADKASKGAGKAAGAT